MEQNGEDSHSSSDDYETAVEITPLQSQNNAKEDTVPRGKEQWQNLLAFWILGLTNNFGYVVMLSAAHDILSHDFTQDNGNQSSWSTANTTTNPRDCNTVSTGAVLLADIVPALVIKMFAPFMCSYIHLRVSAVVVLCSCSFAIVGAATSRTMAIVGVVFASAASGLGETSFLQYAANFHRNVLSTWSSGTGGAGVFGALAYAVLTSVGLTPRNSLLSMLLVPIAMALGFWVLLKHPHEPQCWTDCSNSCHVREEGERILSARDPPASLSLAHKFQAIPSLLRYMVPLTVVYIAEYVINQGLLELIYFPQEKMWLNHHEQYRWYQVIYQVGVFVSRSSVNCVHIHHIWKTSVLQWINVVLLLTCAIFWWIRSIWLVFVLVLWEGLLGGAAYVNTFYKISQEQVDDAHKEFAMGMTTFGDSMGVTIAGFIAIPLHNVICSLPLSRSHK
ncbi:battenin-like [Homarus americanus]|uniref:battenin-like n=1 Tax=Homarus americanus TaxID=6706 RepID=UPI001C48CBAD|nr:battenin-like [Homarus americanus]